jgi:hypothetical protein
MSITRELIDGALGISAMYVRWGSSANPTGLAGTWRGTAFALKISGGVGIAYQCSNRFVCRCVRGLRAQNRLQLAGGNVNGLRFSDSFTNEAMAT